ncbi:MAG: putative sugar nucleotidyl transferase [Phycisphaerales bacterium]|jgi:UDP-N-acetylglucosamine diphosphorylase/glucosamine-1-phosphate N-acetyltransferase
MNRLVIFDDGKGQLDPLTDLRPVYSVRTGCLTTIERQSRFFGVRPGALWVPEALRDLARVRSSDPVNPENLGAGNVTLLNGRCVLPPGGLMELAPGAFMLEEGSGDVIGACLDATSALKFLKTGATAPRTTLTMPSPALLSRPWHVRSFRDRAMRMDLELLLLKPSDPAREGVGSDDLFEAPMEPLPPEADSPQAIVLPGHGVSIDRSAKVYPGAILDAENGPIVIARDAVIRPGAMLIGPCYVGPGSTVLERATIRAFTAIGPACKVNGEVGGTIFQGYANKAHDGYLGDAFVGEWVNLGAGTTVSNLLNTYGEVVSKASPMSGNERTGEMFLGPVIGDHVKTAICTRLMTGSVLATGGMFACTAAVSGATGRFAWRTDSGEQTFRVSKFIDTAKTVMARRRVEMPEAYAARIRVLHEGGE